MPGEGVPIRGIHRLLPGHVARWENGRLDRIDSFNLKEQVDPRLSDQKETARFIREHSHAQEHLLDGLKPYQLFRQEYLERLLDGRLGGIRPRHGAKIWLLLTLEAWLRAIDEVETSSVR